MNIQHAPNIGPLAPLANASREEQLAHIGNHIGNFEGIMMQQVPHDAQDPINAIIGHARDIRDQFLQNVHTHTDEEFTHAIHTALQHLNRVSELIAQHQQQPTVVPPNNNTVNNQVDDGNDTDSTHGSDHSSLPSFISDISENSNVVENQNEPQINNSDNELTDSSHVSGYSGAGSLYSNMTEAAPEGGVHNIEGHNENADPLAAQLMHAGVHQDNDDVLSIHSDNTQDLNAPAANDVGNHPVNNDLNDGQAFLPPAHFQPIDPNDV